MTANQQRLLARWQDSSIIGALVEVPGLIGTHLRTVASCYENEGGVRLNEPVDGVRSWHIDELFLLDSVAIQKREQRP